MPATSYATRSAGSTPMRSSTILTSSTTTRSPRGRRRPIVRTRSERPMGRHAASAQLASVFERARAEAATCRDCPLYRDATQVVFGEGPVPAKLMLLGEQPGDKED